MAYLTADILNWQNKFYLIFRHTRKSALNASIHIRLKRSHICGTLLVVHNFYALLFGYACGNNWRQNTKQQLYNKCKFTFTESFNALKHHEMCATQFDHLTVLIGPKFLKQNEEKNATHSARTNKFGVRARPYQDEKYCISQSNEIKWIKNSAKISEFVTRLRRNINNVFGVAREKISIRS